MTGKTVVRMIRPLIVAVAAAGGCFGAFAEEITDSLSLRAYFRQNYTKIELGYCDNGNLLDAFVAGVKNKLTDPSCCLVEIRVRAGASPEGKFDYNRELSFKRGRNLRLYLQDKLSVPASKFVVEAVGEDWAALKDIVAKRDVPYREEILDILDRYSAYIYGKPTSVMGGPKKEMMELAHGRAWLWLVDNIFPELRSVSNVICFFARVNASGESNEAHSAEGVDEYAAGSAPQPADADSRSNDTLVVIHKYVFELDTIMMSGNSPVHIQVEVPGNHSVVDSGNVQVVNPFVDATFSPNIEVRTPEDGKNVSVSVDNRVVIPPKKNQKSF